MSDAGRDHALGDYLADLLGGDAGDAAPVVAQRDDDLAVLAFDGPGVGFAVACTQAGLCRPAGEHLTADVPNPSWLVGVAELDGALAWLVDCARLLCIDAVPTPSRYWLPVGEGDVALVLAAEPQAQVLARSDIAWRGPAGRRPWLAGTASASRRALLDPEGLAALCAGEDR